jgi:hypothetical protein
VIFRTLFRAGAKKQIPREELPVLHSFVEVAVGGRTARSVSVEEVGHERIGVGDKLGRVGERGVFVYQNSIGKFRFATNIIELQDGTTFFAMPERIEALGGGGAQKRLSMRIDTLVAGMWRMAPGGEGVGEFLKGSIRDISRGGCSLIMDRQCKVGQTLEVKISLNSGADPVTVLGEVMRTEQVPTSGKFSHGLRFRGVTPAEDHAILEYINRKQSELRSRGLA